MLNVLNLLDIPVVQMLTTLQICILLSVFRVLFLPLSVSGGLLLGYGLVVHNDSSVLYV